MTRVIWLKSGVWSIAPLRPVFDVSGEFEVSLSLLSSFSLIVSLSINVFQPIFMFLSLSFLYSVVLLFLASSLIGDTSAESGLSFLIRSYRFVLFMGVLLSSELSGKSTKSLIYNLILGYISLWSTLIEDFWLGTILLESLMALDSNEKLLVRCFCIKLAANSSLLICWFCYYLKLPC